MRLLNESLYYHRAYLLKEGQVLSVIRVLSAQSERRLVLIFLNHAI